jgi:hypothetical protein
MSCPQCSAGNAGPGQAEDETISSAMIEAGARAMAKADNWRRWQGYATQAEHCLRGALSAVPQPVKVTDEMVTAAMRAFEPMSSVLRYREKDKWHSCDIMGMRDALKAALSLPRPQRVPQ